VASKDRFVVAIDQGTSATKALLVDSQGEVRSRASVPLRQHHPRPGWAEQDAEELWESVERAVAGSVHGFDPADIVAVGLSTQRESTVLWDRATGQALAPILGWQDGRHAEFCAAIRAEGHGERVRKVSGLPLDAMFSASKATWLLDTHDPDRSRSRAGELCLGTVDSWLLWNLTGEHVIESGNAARTQLLDISTRTWDPWLLNLFSVPAEVLPEVRPSTGPFRAIRGLGPVPAGVRVTSVMGDSHAALFAHGARQPGQVKATYGTGSSVMGLAGEQPGSEESALAWTIAWETDRPYFALEGNIRASGATLVWLANLFARSPGELAGSAAASSDGVILVPAFTGLGAPWWDDQAKALLVGFTEGTRAEHLARAALESIAFQIEDVIAEVERHVGRIETVFADGGPTDNPVLMQLQADLSGRRVNQAVARDLSALGAAHLAGLEAGVWTDEQLLDVHRPYQPYIPQWDGSYRAERFGAWHDAVTASRTALTPAPRAEMAHGDSP
jgi:glycerol kinase